jgi:hypothetical protein
MNVHGVTFAVSRIADVRRQEMRISALGWQNGCAGDENKRCDESSQFQATTDNSRGRPTIDLLDVPFVAPPCLDE